MTQTVDELRNEIRLSVGRFERQESTAFTKETLAAICDDLNYDIERTRLPSKSQMRAGIRWKLGAVEADDPDTAGAAFRKADLEAIAAAL